MGSVPRSSLRLGGLLAEGGEGRVYEVVAAPELEAGGPVARSGGAGQYGEAAGGGGAVGRRFVYKQLRHARPLDQLLATVAFPADLAGLDPGLAARTWSSAAWPFAAVVGKDPALAEGTLMPLAARRFWARHRDGTARLATLSYLAGDPDRIAVAYGVPLPAPGGAERVALVYTLCRLVESWQPHGMCPHAVHGDLSAKNVLWSLSPTPAVYVLDCDGAAVDGASPGGPVQGEVSPPGGKPRLRATTPNWDDPARPAGTGPTEAVDRYALGLAFLRVVGAANFPLQSRQRTGGKVNVDLELPRSWRRFPDMPALWELCERSLSLSAPQERPSASEWSAQLEELLGVLGASQLAADARESQGDPRPAGQRGGAGGTLPKVPDVVVRPILRQRATPTWKLVDARSTMGAGAGESLPGMSAASGVGPREVARRTLTAWGGAHRLALRLVRSPGRRWHGLRRMAGALLLDVAAACLVLFLVGMVVSPWIGL